MPRGSNFKFGPESKERPIILSQNIANDRLSKDFVTLIVISKTSIFQLKFSELLGPVIQSIVSLIEPAEVDSTIFGNRFRDVF